MTVKITATTQSCDKCPYKRYRTAGRYECSKVEQDILDLTQIAPFCPLGDFPARIIAGMEQTIVRLREPYSHSLLLANLNHVATKLNLDLKPDGGGIDIPCQNGKTELVVCFDIRNIIEFDIRSHGFTFVSGSETYRLMPDADPPRLDLLLQGEEKNLSRQITISRR